MIRTAVFVAGAFCVSGAVSAHTFSDNVGNHLAGGDLHDFFQSQGFDHLDLVSVDITHDAQFLYIDITANADLDATTWGKYTMGINTGLGNPTTPTNGWGRNIGFGQAQEIDWWVGSWTDDGGSGMGGELWQYNGVDWGGGPVDATYLAGTAISGSDAGHALGIQSIVLDYTVMGLGAGDTFSFDVFSTAGGASDPGVDHLSRSGTGDWSTDDWANQSSGRRFLTYTIPAPGTAALLGLGGLAAIRRRR